MESDISRASLAKRALGATQYLRLVAIVAVVCFATGFALSDVVRNLPALPESVYLYEQPWLSRIVSAVNAAWLAINGLPVAAYGAAAFLVTSTGFLATIPVLLVRRRLAQSAAVAGPDRLTGTRYAAQLRRLRADATRYLAARHGREHRIAGWSQIALALALSGFVCAWLGALLATPLEEVPVAGANTLFALGGLFLVAAFPLVVLERTFATVDAALLPEARALQASLRVALAAMLVLGIAAMLEGAGMAWPVWLERAVAVLLLLVAAEIALRGAIAAFLPIPPIEEQQTFAVSTVARCIQFRAPTARNIGIAVERQFGIDLSRSWALGFVSRAVLPVLAGMLLVGWLLTGVVVLGHDERGVYERAGVPVAVLGPGLHVGLPLPFGVVRRTEFGTMHQIAIVLQAGSSPTTLEETEFGSAADEPPDAEGLPPRSADRLWDQSHPSEGSYLIARQSDARQNFEIVDIDVRLVYRVGLADEAAKSALYSTVQPERLIRAASGRFLARYFATRTLPMVLGEDRQTFTNLFRESIQAELDALGTGLETVEVIVEAIHPPPGAASAYHYVQAAGINAQIAIATEQASAVQKIKGAELDAIKLRNDAKGAAVEATSKAAAESRLFDADRQANLRNAGSFIFERWLARLATSFDKKSLLLVDHRLLGRDVPTLDLRDPVGLPADPFPKSR